MENKAKQKLQQKIDMGLAIDDGDREAIIQLLAGPSPQHEYKSKTHEERFMHIHFPIHNAAEKVLELKSVVNLLDENTPDSDAFLAAANFLITFSPPRFIGGTVFARKEDDGIWYGSVSLCSSADQFTRKAGRASARRRYFANPKQELTQSEKIDFNGLRDAILNLREKVDEYEFEHLLQRNPEIFKTLAA